MKMNPAPISEPVRPQKEQVMTFGLSDEENKIVEDALPSKEYIVFDTNAPADLISLSASAVIIKADALSEEDREMLYWYYSEIKGCSDETVFWLGEPEPPNEIRPFFKCYESFSIIADNMKYLLLTAHKKSKNARDFSRKLTYCMMIMKAIREKPGIRSQELADKLELSVRTIQRYISALQTAGEWIEYDTEKRGWMLQDGISPFFDNF